GRVNRDGIGAVVTFQPDGGLPVMKPIISGGSFGSASSLWADFGLGHASKGIVDILWPGGARNRLYDVHNGEKIVFPEIPCSYDTQRSNSEYAACVQGALAELVDAGVIGSAERGRLLASAMRAFNSRHH